MNFFSNRRSGSSSKELCSLGEQQVVAHPTRNQELRDRIECDIRDNDDGATVDSEDGEESCEHFRELFHKFCSSSTIHGTYFWSESHSYWAKLCWGLIVVFGVVSAIYIVNRCFEGWRANPVITSVMQKSIEEIPFPAITICPMEDTRFQIFLDPFLKLAIQLLMKRGLGHVKGCSQYSESWQCISKASLAS